jgi:dihydropyrimidinase
LRSGLLSTVCSDHIPYSLATKTDSAHTFATVPPGMANLETQMPMLYSEGVRNGRLSLNRMVEALCTNPARIAGLAPRKGTIVPGADADIVVFDPEKRRTIRAPEMQSAADYDMFEGWEITGWPAVTISRGEVIFEQGRATARPGRGQFVPRARFTGL